MGQAMAEGSIRGEGCQRIWLNILPAGCALRYFAPVNLSSRCIYCRCLLRRTELRPPAQRISHSPILLITCKALAQLHRKLLLRPREATMAWSGFIVNEHRRQHRRLLRRALTLIEFQRLHQPATTSASREPSHGVRSHSATTQHISTGSTYLDVREGATIASRISQPTHLQNLQLRGSAWIPGRSDRTSSTVRKRTYLASLIHFGVRFALVFEHSVPPKRGGPSSIDDLAFCATLEQ